MLTASGESNQPALTSVESMTVEKDASDVSGLPESMTTESVVDAQQQTRTNTHIFTPGNRLKKLTKAIENALDGVTRDCSTEKFAAAFPQLGRDNPKLLELARQQVLDSLLSKSKTAFHTHVQQRNLDTLLHELDAIVLEAQLNPTLPIQLTPDRIMLAHRVKNKEGQREELQAELARLRQENAELISALKCSEQNLNQMKNQVLELKENLIPNVPLPIQPQDVLNE